MGTLISQLLSLVLLAFAFSFCGQSGGYSEAAIAEDENQISSYQRLSTDSTDSQNQSGPEVVILPGTLLVSETSDSTILVVEKGDPETYKRVSEDLDLATTITTRKIGSTVIIRPLGEAQLVGSLLVTLPISNSVALGLNETSTLKTSEGNFAVFYSVFDESLQSFVSGVIGRNELLVEEDSTGRFMVTFKAFSFGSYQPVILEDPIKNSLKAKSIATEILNIQGEAVISKAKKTEIVTEETAFRDSEKIASSGVDRKIEILEKQIEKQETIQDKLDQKQEKQDEKQETIQDKLDQKQEKQDEKFYFKVQGKKATKTRNN